MTGPTPLLPALNWHHHQVTYTLDPRRDRCPDCGRPALMRDEHGQPRHKVCAEAVLVACHGVDGATRVAAAGYPPRNRRGDVDGGRPGAR